MLRARKDPRVATRLLLDEWNVDAKAFPRDELLAWFAENARPMPWRETRDPYAIWVSEIMLQQTQVRTVIPYFERFMEAFPTTKSLADASLDDVLARWSGLGYYRRARLLYKGVAEVVEKYGGKVPEDRDARLALPGIGPYTAGAIGSIAFSREEPLLDGNVMRVLTRYFAIEKSIKESRVQSGLWAIAAELVRGQAPGDFNQSLMELGATVCTPSSPDCGGCPIADSCQARARGLQDSLPIVPKKKAAERRDLVAIVPFDNASGQRRVWLHKQEGELFGGLWTPPMVDVTGCSDVHDTTGFVQHLERYGLSRASQGVLMGPLGKPVVHVLSHRRLSVSVYALQLEGSEDAAGQHTASVLRPHPISSLHGLGVSRLTHKVLAAATSVELPVQ